jgi:hypothetical protein
MQSGISRIELITPTVRNVAKGPRTTSSIKIVVTSYSHPSFPRKRDSTTTEDPHLQKPEAEMLKS